MASSIMQKIASADAGGRCWCRPASNRRAWSRRACRPGTDIEWLKQHVSKVASSCFYQLRRLKQVRIRRQ